MLHLTLFHQDQQRVIPLVNRSAWRIGRSPSCEICVPDPYVSAEHAVLEFAEKRLRLRQLGGANPILVDGRRTPNAVLLPGATFTIGMTAFLVGPVVLNLEGPRHPLDADLLPSGTTLVDSVRILRAAPQGSDPGAGAASLMADITQILSHADSPEAIAQCLLRLLCPRLNANRGFVAKAISATRLELVAFTGFPRNGDIAQLISRSVLRRVMADGSAVLIRDTEESLGDGQMTESVIFKHIRAVACVPILNPDRNMDAILYLDNLDRPSEFTVRDAEFLIWLGQFYWLLSREIEIRRNLEAQIAELKSAAAQSGTAVVTDLASIGLDSSSLGSDSPRTTESALTKTSTLLNAQQE